MNKFMVSRGCFSGSCTYTAPTR